MTGNANLESRMMTEPKEIKLFDLKANKRYDITAISKSDDVGPTNGLIFTLEGNLKLYLSDVDLFSDSSEINELYSVINKKPNQECYLIFCFIETYFYHGSAAFIYLLWTLVLLVAYLSKIYH
jgi:hypothetical protein